MRGLGRISVRSVHARGIGGIGIQWMQNLEKIPKRIKSFGTFVETQNLEMRCLGRIRIQVVHSRGIIGIGIYWNP